MKYNRPAYTKPAKHTLENNKAWVTTGEEKITKRNVFRLTRTSLLRASPSSRVPPTCVSFLARPSLVRPAFARPALTRLPLTLLPHFLPEANNFMLTFRIIAAQSGFRSIHSTVTALLATTNNWAINIDNGLLNGVLFIDLKKAFDTIDHEIILRKLANYGVDPNALRFFASYLCNRSRKCSERVVVNLLFN